MPDWGDKNDVIAFFTRADADHDGQLTFEELWNVLHKHDSSFTRKALQVFFRIADIDRNGTISLEELYVALDRSMLKIPRESQVDHVFRVLDRRDRVRIDWVDILFAALDMNTVLGEKEIRRFIAKFDQDRTGTLNYHDITEALLHILNKHYHTPVDDLVETFILSLL